MDMIASPAAYRVNSHEMFKLTVTRRRIAVKLLVSIVVVVTAIFGFTNNTSAQVISADSTLSVTGLVEAYYVLDADQPASNNRPSFLYNHTRTNEVTVNLAYVKMRYADSEVRANLALMSGTYAQANLAAELPIWRNLFEANAGARLSKSENLWVDAGLYASHIGFESAIGKDNWTLTRSLAAENSPYYESGARVTYVTPNNAWTLCAHVLNGWQQIQRPAGNSGLSWGTQVVYQPNSDVTINSSTFIGNTKTDNAKQLRLFHNFYGIFSLSPSLGLILGFDFGSEEQAAKGSSSVWYAPVAIVRYRVDESKYVAARVEYYQDKDGVIVLTGTANGFNVVGGSLNFDYAISKNSLWRIEGRALQSRDRIFVKSDGVGESNFSVTTSLSVFF